MPLPGGPSDKAGNRYEARWTVACMARVLRGEYDSIRLEPPGAEGQGIEFYLRRGDALEYHQVKRQGARSGHWTLRELRDTGVFAAFRSHLADPNAMCVFVSSQDAYELRELSDRARSAADLREFEAEFAKGEWGARLSELVQHWAGCTGSGALSLLKRIQVRTIDEVSLRRQAELELAPLVHKSPSAAADILFAYAFESIHLELDPPKIRGRLDRCGIKQPAWVEPRMLAAIVEKTNERYLAAIGRELIRGELIPRDEGNSLLAVVQGPPTKRGVIVTGKAGTGKSTVLLQTIRSLQQQAVPFLALRVDRLEPTQRPDDVGHQMGLEASPIATLDALARGRPCVLVLDQLDAVSLISGRNPWFLECFDEMVRQAITRPAMQILIACRRFDFDNDHRFRRLGGGDQTFAHIDVGALSDDTVRRTVQAFGIEPSPTERQVKLLSVPAHLKLLSEVAQGAGTSLTFQTANQLYGLYWQRKDQFLRARLGLGATWVTAIDRLCEYMSERQVLSAPATILDDSSAVRDALISEHVLVHDGGRISFFHEGFFDYSFARRFAAKGSDLLGLLRSGEQHLFRRAQVRQILLHQREIDRSLYLNNLQTLLASTDIRFHIQQVVFALVAQFTDPTAAEWRILEALLQDPGYPNRDQVYFATRTLPWFKLLDSLGVVAAWLGHSDTRVVDRAVMLLRGLERDAGDRIAELVEPYVGTSPEWRNRCRYLVAWADLAARRRFFELFLRLIANGDLDDTGRFRENDFFGFLHGMPEKHADWSCEAIGRYLMRRLTLSLDVGETNPFNAEGLRYSQVSDEILVGSAQRAPSAFVQHVLPFVLRVAQLNAPCEGEKPWEDAVWRWRWRDGGHDVAGHLLHASERALCRLAREAPEEFCGIVAPLLQSEYETVQFLLIRAYSANGERFAEEAIDYLCASAQRLQSGYFGADGPHRASRELIEAASPFCSCERLAKLETMLLEYYPEAERTADGREWRGQAQFELLLAIDQRRRSTTVEARIGEWQRKFRLDAPLESPRSGVEWVGSPIPNTAAEKMTDDHWLGAIARYGTREHEWRDGNPVGGPHELSQTLETQVKADPNRFARLVLRFPDDTNSAYFCSVLAGLAGGTADSEAIFEACRRCHRLPKQPAGSAFARLVEKLPGLAWPDDLLDALAWYATEDPDPDHELWRANASSGRPYYGGDIYTAGINCVRGAAAEAIRELLFADADRMPRFIPTLHRMVRDPSISVRSCVGTALLALLNPNRDLAIELFRDLCDTEDVLLRTRHVEEFMRYATVTHFSQLLPIVERMLRSNDPEVAQAGARRACVASLGLEEAGGLAKQCLSGSEFLRAGAAQVFAANVGEARFRSVCEGYLIGLFNDPSEMVRSLASECFDELGEEALGETTTLVEGFQDSAAFAANHKRLIRSLERTSARLPDVTISVCERFIKLTGMAAGDMRTQAAADAHAVSELIIRAYHQTARPDLSRRCLDTIDRLLRVGAMGLQDALREFER